MIDIQGLDVVFGHGKNVFHAVRDVSLRVEKGQSFGLVGESGSGKTTVLRALAGILERVARVSGEMIVADETLLRHRSQSFGGACKWYSRTRSVHCIRATPSIRF